MSEYNILKGGRGNMKTILITQAQFRKHVQKTMHKYTDKVRAVKNKDGEEYTKAEEMADVLEMSIIFALLEFDLFDRG